MIVNGDPQPAREDLPHYGAGETVCKPMLAAVANAIFDATGVRLRRVPFRRGAGARGAEGGQGLRRPMLTRRAVLVQAGAAALGAPLRALGTAGPAARRSTAAGCGVGSSS